MKTHHIAALGVLAAVIAGCGGEVGVPSAGPSVPADQRTPEEVGREVFDRLGRGDAAAVREMLCADHTMRTATIVQRQVDRITAARFTGVDRPRSDEFELHGTATDAKGEIKPWEGTAERENGRWCLSDIGVDAAAATPSSTPRKKPPTAQSGSKLVKRFVARINAADELGAMALTCDDAVPVTESMVGWAVHTAKVQVAIKGTRRDGKQNVRAKVTANRGRVAFVGDVTASWSGENGYCIDLFVMSPVG